MANGEFEALSKKVEQVVAKVEELKNSRDQLKSELSAALERAGSLERELAGKSGEIDGLRQELEKKSENMSLAGERIRGLVTRLETALA